MQQKILTGAAGAMLLALSAFAASAAELTVTDPWIRSAPPNAPALGAFMELRNDSDKDIHVVDARTTLQVNRVELHRTMMADGVMKMIPQKSIPVPAHSATLLKPGSWHVMLIGPDRVPSMDDVIDLTLVYGDGSEQVVAATVRQGNKMMHNHEHQTMEGQCPGMKNGQGHKMGEGHDHKMNAGQCHKMKAGQGHEMTSE